MKLEKGAKLRNFRLEDLKTLEGFYKKSTRINFPGIKLDISNFRKNLLKYSKKEPGGIRVLEKGGEIIGYVWLNTRYSSFRKKRFGLIRKLFIKESYRGKGFAKKLLKFTEGYFKKKKVAYITLNVTLTNKAALNLYRKASYKEKRVTMEKEL